MNYKDLQFTIKHINSITSQNSKLYSLSKQKEDMVNYVRDRIKRHFNEVQINGTYGEFSDVICYDNGIIGVQYLTDFGFEIISLSAFPCR